MVLLVNGETLTSFPRPLDRDGKVRVLDLPPRLEDDELKLLLEAYHGLARIRQTPDESVEVEIYISRDGLAYTVYGVARDQWKMGIHGESSRW